MQASLAGGFACQRGLLLSCNKRSKKAERRIQFAKNESRNLKRINSLRSNSILFLTVSAFVFFTQIWWTPRQFGSVYFIFGLRAAPKIHFRKNRLCLWRNLWTIELRRESALWNKYVLSKAHFPKLAAENANKNFQLVAPLIAQAGTWPAKARKKRKAVWAWNERTMKQDRSRRVLFVSGPRRCQVAVRFGATHFCFFCCETKEGPAGRQKFRQAKLAIHPVLTNIRDPLPFAPFATRQKKRKNKQTKFAIHSNVSAPLPFAPFATMQKRKQQASEAYKQKSR